jgi:serine/threonine-protein kinase RsbW
MDDKNNRSLILQSAEDQIQHIKSFLEELQKWAGFDDQKFSEIRLALNEAVTNAIIHGNKNDLSKKVTINAVKNDHSLTIHVRDEGEGFDVGDIPNPTDENNLLKPTGRGIFLIRQQANEVSFKEKATISMQFDLE